MTRLKMFGMVSVLLILCSCSTTYKFTEYSIGLDQPNETKPFVLYTDRGISITEFDGKKISIAPMAKIPMTLDRHSIKYSFSDAEERTIYSGSGSFDFEPEGSGNHLLIARRTGNLLSLRVVPIQFVVAAYRRSLNPPGLYKDGTINSTTFIKNANSVAIPSGNGIEILTFPGANSVVKVNVSRTRISKLYRTDKPNTALAINSDRRIFEVDLDSRLTKEIKYLPKSKGKIACIFLSNDTLVVALDDGTVDYFDTTTERTVRSMNGLPKVNEAHIAGSEVLLISGNNCMLLGLANDPQKEMSFQSSIKSADISINGLFSVVLTEDQTIYLIDNSLWRAIPFNDCIYPSLPRGDFVISFSEDGRYLNIQLSTTKGLSWDLNQLDLGNGGVVFNDDFGASYLFESRMDLTAIRAELYTDFDHNLVALKLFDKGVSLVDVELTKEAARHNKSLEHSRQNLLQ